METFAQQFFNLLVSPPGNLIYHLVLAFSITASIQAALGKHIRLAQARLRLIIGLSVLLLGQIVLFLSSGLAWQGMVNPRIFLPPLDRAIALFSLVWIFWLWAFPEKTRFSDIFIGFASLVIFILFLLTTGIWYNQPANLPFNNSWWDWIWGLAAIVFSVSSMVYFILQRPPTWGMGLGVISVNLVGYVAHLTLMPPTGDYAPLLRLAHICSFPLLPTLAQRLYELNPPLAPSPVSVPAAPKFSSIDFPILRAWIDFATQEDTQSLCNGLTRALAANLKAEISILVCFDTTTNLLKIDCGYNLIKDKPVAKQPLKIDQVPLLMDCIRKNTISLIKFNEATKFNLQGISPILELSEPMDILVFPIPSNASREIKALLFLNPENKRPWHEEELTRLQALREELAVLLYQKPEELTPGSKKDGQNRAEVDRLNQNIVDLENQNKQMEDELDQLSTQYLNLQQENEILKTKFSQLQQDLLFLSSQLSAEVSAEEKLPTSNLAEAVETVHPVKDKLNIDELQQENIKLQSQLEQLLKENTRLKELLDNLEIPETPEKQTSGSSAPSPEDETFEELLNKMQKQTDRLEAAESNRFEKGNIPSEKSRVSFFDDIESHEDEVEWELPSFMEPSAKEKTQPIKIRRTDTPASLTTDKHLEKLIQNLKMENDMLFARLRETQQLNAADSAALENLNLELQQALEKISQLEADLQTANQKLAALSQPIPPIVTTPEQFEMINAILVELEGPMSSMNGYMEMLLSDNIGKLGVVHKRLVERMKDSHERVSQLLGQLMAIGSVPSNIQPGIYNTPGISDLVTQSLIGLDSTIQQKHISLETNIQETFPPIDLSSFSEVITKTLKVWVDRAEPNSQGLIEAHVKSDNGSRLFYFHVNGVSMSLIGDVDDDIRELKTFLNSHNGELAIINEEDGTTTIRITLPITA